MSSDGDEVSSSSTNTHVVNGLSQLHIDDAFSTGDNDDDDLDAAGFDVTSIMQARRQQESYIGNSFKASAGHDERDRDLRGSSPELVAPSSLRYKRSAPSPLIIPTTNVAQRLPQVDIDREEESHGERFQDVSLSPPSSPRATTSLSPNNVPVPLTPHSPMPIPSRSSVGKSLSRPPSVLRSVSPRPSYLSPTSSVPTPPAIDPIPVRAPTPSAVPPPVLPPPQATITVPDSPRASRRPLNTASALEKVLSKTRPSHLPPKPRAEDVKHQRDWNIMMARSRQLEGERAVRKKADALAKEQQVGSSMFVWEKEILPEWKRVLKPGPDGDRLRKLWWRGIPVKFRGRLWLAAIGNGLALSKETYRTCSHRAQRALSSGSFPASVLEQIDEDVRGTLPNLQIFHPEHGAMYQDLKDLLCAWVVARADEGLDYVRGASNIAAMLVLNLPLEQAFTAMRNLLERHCLRSFFGGDGSSEDLEAYYRIFDTLLADGMPKVYFNFKQHQVPPAMYLRDWILPLYLNHLPFESCARIWDTIILEGDSFVFKVAIAVLGVLEGRLFFPDRQELLEVLRGENKAALEVARRTGIAVDVTARYEQYGMNDGALWDRIYEMDDWWRDSTWARLIQRELPDL